MAVDFKNSIENSSNCLIKAKFEDILVTIFLCNMIAKYPDLLLIKGLLKFNCNFQWRIFGKLAFAKNVVTKKKYLNKLYTHPEIQNQSKGQSWYPSFTIVKGNSCVICTRTEL